MHQAQSTNKLSMTFRKHYPSAALLVIALSLLSFFFFDELAKYYAGKNLIIALLLLQPLLALILSTYVIFSITKGCISKEVEKSTAFSALLLVSLSFALSTYKSIIDEVGRFDTEVMGALFNHPQALLNFIATGLGGSVALPLIHIFLFTLFKSKRNPKTYIRILIGWSIVTIIVTAFYTFIYPS